MKTVILRTACGCERTAEANEGDYEIVVPVMSPISLSTVRDVEDGVITLVHRRFRYDGTRGPTQVYREVLDDENKATVKVDLARFTASMTCIFEQDHEYNKSMEMHAKRNLCLMLGEKLMDLIKFRTSPSYSIHGGTVYEAEVTVVKERRKA